MLTSLFFANDLSEKQKEELSQEDIKKTLAQFRDFGNSPGLNLEKLRSFKNPAIFSIRINLADRILLQLERNIEGVEAVVVGVVRNHDYQKFEGKNILKNNLCGKEFLHRKTKLAELPETEDKEKYQLLNIENAPEAVIYGNSILSLSEAQKRAIKQALGEYVGGDEFTLPLLISGAPGSGKTMIAAELLRSFVQDDKIEAVAYAGEADAVYEEPRKRSFYFAPTSRLVEMMKSQIKQQSGDDALVENEKIVATTYLDFVRSNQAHIAEIKDKHIVGEEEFKTWRQQHSPQKKQKQHAEIAPETLYHELQIAATCKDKQDYNGLGARQSKASQDVRNEVWKILAEYKTHLSTEEKFDPNLVALDLSAFKAGYDSFVTIDECQSFSNMALLSMKSLCSDEKIMFVGDSNQSMLNPVSNEEFLKLQFFDRAKKLNTANFSYSYRCPKAVFEAAETLRILTIRRTSERNHAASATAGTAAAELQEDRSLGNCLFYAGNAEVAKFFQTILPRKTTPAAGAAAAEPDQQQNSAALIAVIVPDEAAKQKAERKFSGNTSIILTAAEALGMEFEHVVLYGITENLHANLFGRDDLAPEDALKAKAAFVAMTRSCKNLIVLHDSNKPFDNELSKKLKESHTDEKVAEVVTDLATGSSFKEWKEKIEQALNSGSEAIAIKLADLVMKSFSGHEEVKEFNRGDGNNSRAALWHLFPEEKVRAEEVARAESVKAAEVEAKARAEAVKTAKARAIETRTRAQQQSNTAANAAPSEKEVDLTELFTAVSAGDVDKVSSLIKNKESVMVNATLSDGNPLFVAAQYGHTNVIELLLKNGANINACAKHGGTALNVATMNNHMGAMKMLLAKEASDIPGKDGKTALHIAAGGGHTIAVKALLENKSDVNAVTKEGETALELAATHCPSQNIVATVLMLARATTDLEGILNAASSITKRNDLDTEIKNFLATELTTLTKTLIRNAIKNGDTKTLNSLIAAGEVLNAAAKSGTVLHFPDGFKDIEFAELLIKKSPCLTKVTLQDGQAAVHVDAQLGNTEIAKLLIKAGADPAKITCKKTTLDPLPATANDNFAAIKEPLEETIKNTQKQLAAPDAAPAATSAALVAAQIGRDRIK
jgi:ankyrin repeat protein